MDFYTIIAPGSVAGCSCGQRQRDILGPAIVGAGAYSQLRQIYRVEEEVRDPVYCLPKIDKVMQPRITTRNSVRALAPRQETVLAELSPRLSPKDSAAGCLRSLAPVTRGSCKIKSGVSTTLAAWDRSPNSRTPHP